MPSPEHPNTQPGAWLWTKRQRAVLAVVVLILAAFFTLRALKHPVNINDPPPPGPLSQNLPARIDPNTADWPAFAALPLIGEKRAKEIIAYRTAWSAEHPNQTPFEKSEDLTRIKGIGQQTIKTLEPYLQFPAIEPQEK